MSHHNNEGKSMLATALSIQEEIDQAVSSPMLLALAKTIVENKSELSNDELIEGLYMLAKISAGTTAVFITKLLLGDDQFEAMTNEMSEWNDLTESIIDEETNAGNN
jgi:hypothetical protein